MEMKRLPSLSAALLFLALPLIPAAQARQNIVIGEISVRYDHQERDYEHPSVQAGETDPAQPVVVVLEDRRGDRQRYIVAPRIRLSSTGPADYLEFTWAPALNYDHLYESTDLDQDLGLRLGRDLNRQWSIRLDERFFLGDDPYLADQLSTALIVPETGEMVEPEAQDGSGSNSDQLTENYGRRRYWRNNLDLATEYRYGPDRKATLALTYAALRNDSGEQTTGYTDYDRYTGRLSVSHRLNRHWRGEGEVRYTRGLFDDPQLVVLAPDDRSVTGTASDDLEEGLLRLRAGYDSTPHLHLFSEYWYQQTDYDAALRRDYSIHNLAVGLEYDFLTRFHLVLSGGPSWGSFENSPTEQDYNFSGSLTYDFTHGSLTLSGDKGYDQENFDGRRSGLTDYWDTGLSMEYRLRRDLSLNLSVNYRDNRRLQVPAVSSVVVDQETLEELAGGDPDLGRVEYTEKDTDAGFSLAYTFLRWYTVVGGYRYFKHDTDSEILGGGSYDEHRFFVQVIASREMWRW